MEFEVVRDEYGRIEKENEVHPRQTIKDNNDKMKQLDKEYEEAQDDRSRTVLEMEEKVLSREMLMEKFET